MDDRDCQQDNTVHHLSEYKYNTPSKPNIVSPIASESTIPQSREITHSRRTSSQQLSTAALEFLSNANNETLSACLIGFAAVIYWIFGRVGLVLIGIGVGLLVSTWHGEGPRREGARSEVDAKRKEEALSIVGRLLDTRQSSRSASNYFSGDSIGSDSHVVEEDYGRFPPVIQQALHGFTDAIIRDYVRYSPMMRHYEGLLTNTDTGTLRSSLQTSPSSLPAELRSPLSSLPSHRTSLGNAQQILSSTFSQMPPQS